MKIARSVRFSIWCFILFNLMIAYCCIWIFVRMIPTIEQVVDNNEISIRSSMVMLSLLTRDRFSLIDDKEAVNRFERFLKMAESTITEEGEKKQLDIIRRHYLGAFNGQRAEFSAVVEAITRVEFINREAMHMANMKAQHMGRTGAWGIVFMAAINFLAGLFFINSLNKKFMEPLEELDRTISEFKSGNSMRRCSIYTQSRGMERMMRNLNDLLDTYPRR